MTPLATGLRRCEISAGTLHFLGRSARILTSSAAGVDERQDLCADDAPQQDLPPDVCIRRVRHGRLLKIPDRRSATVCIQLTQRDAEVDRDRFQHPGQAGDSQRQVGEGTGLSLVTVRKYLAADMAVGLAQVGHAPNEVQLSRYAGISWAGPRRVETPIENSLVP